MFLENNNDEFPQLPLAYALQGGLSLWPHCFLSSSLDFLK